MRRTTIPRVRVDRGPLAFESGYLQFLEERHRTLKQIGNLLPCELRAIAELIEQQRARIAALKKS
jgi:hypothetical protein